MKKEAKKKNAFHFTLKAISILKIFQALSKYDTEPGKQIIAIHIYCPIPREV